MIIHELYRLYLRLLEENPDMIPKKGWSVEKVTWALLIDKHGSLVGINYLGGEGAGAKKYRTMMVPEHDTRSGIKPVPFMLCDTAAYLLGLDEKHGEAKHRLSCEKHLDLISGCKGQEAKALRMFFSRDDAARNLKEEEREALAGSGFCVLHLSGSGFAHEIPELVDAWNSRGDDERSSAQLGQCGVTGKVSRLARLFPQVTGIPGAQGAGASLVSFNKQSFESFGKTQAYNASISEEVAFGAGTALKYLYQDNRHNIKMGNTTIVFWSDRRADAEDALMLRMLGGRHAPAEDEVTLQLVKTSLECMRAGRVPVSLDPTLRYYILGISPNAARLAVRFFEVGTLGWLAENFSQYLRDIDIDCDSRFSEHKSIALFELLRQTALLGKDENLPSTLVGPCFRAMIHGTAFPRSLEAALLSRMRADRGSNKPWDLMERASLMKACLVRKRRLVYTQPSNLESEVTVSLNRENNNVGYLLGRLFAVMERAQQGAQGMNINATIRDKYMSTAATTPTRVYANLLGLCQKHLGVMRRDSSKQRLLVRIEKELEEVVDRLSGDEQSIPAALNSDDQVMFYIGYYQERVALWKKNLEGSSAEEV